MQVLSVANGMEYSSVTHSRCQPEQWHLSMSARHSSSRVSFQYISCSYSVLPRGLPVLSDLVEVLHEISGITHRSVIWTQVYKLETKTSNVISKILHSYQDKATAFMAHSSQSMMFSINAHKWHHLPFSSSTTNSRRWHRKAFTSCFHTEDSVNCLLTLQYLRVIQHLFDY